MMDYVSFFPKTCIRIFLARSDTTPKSTQV